jgi:hypothetical protein
MRLEGFSCVYDAPAPPTQQLGPQWSSRWGAIAIDPTVSQGGLGVVSDMRSERSAEKAAIKQCQKAEAPNNAVSSCRTTINAQ